ncbi:hypothetical protein ACH5RR_037272 [Cinchona calisaya]|uniref:Uncharacterized protein n=1 Tax=Cinchona calisaya TaxID=153742 RepID=A0ABD2Y6Z0_9GENT
MMRGNKHWKQLNPQEMQKRSWSPLGSPAFPGATFFQREVAPCAQTHPQRLFTDVSGLWSKLEKSEIFFANVNIQESLWIAGEAVFNAALLCLRGKPRKGPRSSAAVISSRYEMGALSDFGVLG